LLRRLLRRKLSPIELLGEGQVHSLIKRVAPDWLLLFALGLGLGSFLATL
jgi:hypothetical protein